MHFQQIALSQKSRRSCIFKCKSFILFVFWGAAVSRWTRTNDRGVEHACYCEKEGREEESQEGDEEEGRQEEEEEVISLIDGTVN